LTGEEGEFILEEMGPNRDEVSHPPKFHIRNSCRLVERTALQYFCFYLCLLQGCYLSMGAHWQPDEGMGSESEVETAADLTVELSEIIDIPESEEVSFPPPTIPAGDINGDGISDLVLGRDFGESAWILFGSPNLVGGTNISEAATHVIGLSSGRVQLCDLDGDHLWDIIGIVQGESYDVDILFGRTVSGNPEGPLRPDLTISFSSELHCASCSGDLDSDGRMDLLVSAVGNVWLYYGKESWPSALDEEEADARLVDFPVDEFVFQAIGIGDLNGDGKYDFAVSGTAGRIHIFLGGERLSGTQSYSTALDFEAEIAGGLGHAGLGQGIGDVDGDGLDDFIGWKYHEAFVILSVESPSPIEAIPVYSGQFMGPAHVPYNTGIGDWNGDGLMDFQLHITDEPVAYRGTLFLVGGKAVWDHRMDLFEESITTIEGIWDQHRFGNDSIGIRDLNADGLPDLAAVGLNDPGQQLYIFYGKPGGWAPRTSSEADLTYDVDDYENALGTAPVFLWLT
jgi:hypothetical protein